MKISLEKDDLEKLIKGKYPTAEIVSGLDNDFEVVIKVTELPTLQPNPPQEPLKNIIRDKRGNIDAKKSGLTLDNNGVTQKGGAMKNNRGRLPVF